MVDWPEEIDTTLSNLEHELEEGLAHEPRLDRSADCGCKQLNGFARPAQRCIPNKETIVACIVLKHRALDKVTSPYLSILRDPASDRARFQALRRGRI